ncbi:phage holin family protein [Geodermatophilus poikilotrophus]|uniref:Putative Holin-X, holin superfamily III n=1 Tax=Geodermatophilus poikilotrophus TaxID=1333667 RepID=A0A1I0F5E5_9ACTN|nr:phage holin family protein [Geodermatophilus poikilotrophus]SET52636.1 Putative Holin-X, holin superfamily III [Geodermatophilus poikilotrophus]
MAHSAPSNPSGARSTSRAEEPSVGALVQSAMADVSTLIRSEIELAKAEVGKSAKKAGIGAGAFGAAAVLLAFSGIFLFVTIAEFLTWLGLERWISYLIVWLLLVVLAGIAALVGRSSLKKIEKPERTIETLRDLPEVIHREAPGQRRREVPTVSNGRVQLRGSENYTV